ncbi:MAG: carbamoyltransferase N-terminal domain-containing protein [Planctomycetota bacterium]|nr:carbamoyltransferase N-terminal domain-containing protein [Planctomycetota bacterium]
MYILGISAHHRDAAAALLIDGEAVAAAREEHFTGLLRDAEVPVRATRFCLEQAGIKPSELDHVVFYEKPLRKFERVLLHQLKAYPRSARSFVHGAFAWLGDQLWTKNRLVKDLGVGFETVLFARHQLALAANAYYTSPFEEAAVLTVDDAGEWATSLSCKASGHQLETTSEVQFPHSLGLVVSAITQFLGFEPGRDEHVVETLAPFGTPRYLDAFRALIPEASNGFTVDQAAFRYAFDSDQLYDNSLAGHLGSPRYSGDPLLIEGDDTRHADIACSLQAILVERVLTLVQDLHTKTASRNLCLAGELANNRRLIAQIADSGPFDRLFVPDAPGKSGGALGAALYAHHALVPDAARAGSRHCAALGESVDKRAEPGARTLSGDPGDEILRRLLEGQRVAWVRGRVEFGACSLGNRLVLALPARNGSPTGLRASLQDTESFLPCRLAMSDDFANTRLTSDPEQDLGELLARAQIRITPQDSALQCTSESPDGTICPQVVSAESDPELHGLLQRIGKHTDLPVLQVDDFALRGSPLVRTEAAAVAALQRSRLDCLIVQDRLYERRAI